MDLRLHPCSVDPTEDHEKCGPNRPTAESLCNNAMRPGPTNERSAALHRGYRVLAARAKHDPIAASQFGESILWLNTHHVEAWAILREHPLMKPGLEGSGRNEAVRFRALNKNFLSDATGLAPVSWTGTDLGFKHSAAAVSSRS